MGVEEPRGREGLDLGSLAAGKALLQLVDAVVGVEAEERVASKGVLASSHGGEDECFEPCGAGLGQGDQEEVSGTRLEVVLDGQGAPEGDWTRDPKALVLSKGEERLPALL